MEFQKPAARFGGRNVPARSVTSAPIAAPSPIGSRPSRRTTDIVRSFGFDVRVLPPFLHASSSAARSATRARSTPDTSAPLTTAPRCVAEVQVPQAGQTLHVRDEGPGEQPLYRRLAVPVDAGEHDLVVTDGAGAPLQDLLGGQVIEDQLLADVIALRLRRGCGGHRTRGGQHDRGHQRGRDVDGRLRGGGFSAGLGSSLPRVVAVCEAGRQTFKSINRPG
ncbi:hypothetical protein ACLQ18_17490 [Streptomyces sp. DT193]|uniref:hypothetical protein n=1 Tax=Streptomyces sp. DT193 TaxID=3393418 RepID=UPI003CF2C47D